MCRQIKSYIFSEFPGMLVKKLADIDGGEFHVWFTADLIEHKVYTRARTMEELKDKLRVWLQYYK